MEIEGDAQAEGLSESEVSADPFEQFQCWLDDAIQAGIGEPYAMTLATADRSGKPSARMVLLRGLDARGFSFFTHYDSRKGEELADNPRAALVFFWNELHRQVRVEGAISQVSSAESDAYFQTRPRGSQLSAWASRQDHVIAGRSVLEERMRQLEQQHQGQPVPRPPYWGGYRLVPEVIEFWQSRLNRLHDRLRYQRTAGGWRIERLSP